ncbi:hypothetical protein DVH24_016705 [Malus domestica]|uniref:LisH domain-containing protein n=1 Tax=Malus domestica TaxID=3750 RepID=A0A498HY90_MALDO|nr:hypothetical protein DVH24_016705 [Malus domestica]
MFLLLSVLVIDSLDSIHSFCDVFFHNFMVRNPAELKVQLNDVVHGYLQRNGHLGFLRSRGFVSDSSGDKKETLAPLVFFGTTGTMLDIIMGITQCEREHAERQAKLLEAQTSATDASFAETGAET